MKFRDGLLGGAARNKSFIPTAGSPCGMKRMDRFV